MDKIFILCIFLFSLSGVSGQPQERGLKITPLTGDFYIYTTYGLYKDSPVPSNSMYLVTSRGVVLFDTPWDSTQFQPLLDSIRSRHHRDVVLCISTHFHADRTAGLEYYRRKGIRTYTTVMTDSLSKIRNEKRARFLIHQDTVFTLGEKVFRTYYGGPGHTPDNMVIWFDKEKILYGGCLVKSTEAEDLGNLADADIKAWPLTIRHIQLQFGKPDYIIPGHLDWHSNASLTHTLELIQQYEEKNKAP